LNFKRGEFVCIIGDVGCGKSSFLSAINGDMLYIPENEIDQNLDGSRLDELNNKLFSTKI
jgi:ABC-type nitrate/sulfonate/bicarbonate transport system ATPase subunit